MKENRALTREEIEDILDRVHIQEYEWFIDDKEDDRFCSSSEEDAELVEKCIKGLISQYKTDYVSKDKIKEVIKKYYNDYEEQKRYRYTRDVEEEQSVLKDIEKELLEEG